MLAVVKSPRIELTLNGDKAALKEFLEFVRSRYSVSVATLEAEADDESSADAAETEFMRNASPGDLLQKFRLKHNLTQAQLSKLTGIAQVTISAYENGKRNLSRRAAAKIGAALGESPEKFFACDR